MRLVYADYNSTYPSEARHIEAVLERLKQVDGNPSNIHPFGRRAKLAVEEARSALAQLVGGKREEIFFTSGATEANNWVVQSVLGRAARRLEGRGHAVISAGEHPSVSQPIKHMAISGLCTFTPAALLASGHVAEDSLLESIQADTVLVALIHAHNEVGAINDVLKLARLVKERQKSVHVHIDAVQALGKLDLQVLGKTGLIDSLALSAHKVGGFKGQGCLWLHDRVALEPILLGGGQERLMRAGTENLAGIISFGLRASEIAAKPSWLEGTRSLSLRFCEGLQKLPAAHVHSDPAHGLPNTVNFHCEGVSAEALLVQFDMAGICVSSGSACSSGAGAASPVLLAMGYSDWVARNSIRVSFGGESTVEDVSALLAVIRQAC